jgi:membrane protease YdiL (CAAX protease family)
VVAAAIAVALLSTTGPWLLLPVLALVAVLFWLSRHGQLGSSTWIAAVCWACVGLGSAASFGLVWPIPQLLGLGVAALIVRRQKLAWPTWLECTKPDRAAFVLAAASVPLTTAALVVFIASGRTNLEDATEGLASLPLWVLPLAGLGFVLANPTVEEVLFRGALQTMITDGTGSPAVGIGIQGVAFGSIHLNGVPGGWLGMLMAGGWGVMLGIVRHRTDSIRLAWVVHVLANVAIFATVTGLAVRDGVL